MNRIGGQIKEITVNGSLSLVTIELPDQTIIRSIVIDTPNTAAYLQEGRKINILFKETELIIATTVDCQISILNRILGHIIDIERGELISKISVATAVGELIAVISTGAADRLSLINSMPVSLMIKQNEIMLSS